MEELEIGAFELWGQILQYFHTIELHIICKRSIWWANKLLQCRALFI